MLDWKDKQDGVDDVLAEDINGIAHAVIKLQEDFENNGADQSYNPDSKNAQSGIAVKEAINQEVGAVDDYGRYGVQNVDGNLTISTATPNDVSQGSNVKPITPAILEYAIASKTDKTYNPDSFMPQSGKAVAEAIDTVGKKKWQLIEDITLTESVKQIDVPWEKLQVKELHIEAKFLFEDAASKEYSFGLSGTAYWKNNRQAQTLYCIMDVYMSPFGRAIFDGTVTQYNYQLGGATAKLSNPYYDKSGGKEYICSQAEKKMFISTTATNGFAVGSKIRMWGR